jgi:hypothetical protein
VTGYLFVAKTQSGSADEPLNIPYNSVKEYNEHVICLGALSVAVIAVLSFLGFA